MTASGTSTGTPSPSPGSGKTTSGGECSDATPCFVCRLKALVAAQGVDGDFHDDPFTINIVGIRRANSITDKFDDRMVVFFSLPAADATKTLKDGGIEGDGKDNLIADINAAAAKMNKDSKDPYRGVRRVPCSRVELEPGKPAAGDRVVLMYPITTDPGLVRLQAKGDLLEDDIKKGQKQIDDAQKQLAELTDAKKTLVDKLLPDFKQAGDDLKKVQAKYPKPKPGQQPTQDVVDAAKKVDDAKKAIDALAAKLAGDLHWRAIPKALTEAELTKQIDAQNKAITALTAAEKKKQADYAAWSSTDMTDKEKKDFEGYHYVFKTKDGWEGDDHALFPLGHMKDAFQLYLHHSASESAAPALTIGNYLGERVITGHTLKLEFEELVGYPRSQRLDPVHAKAVKASKAREKAFKQALAKVDKDAKKALLAQQDEERKAAQAQDDAAEEEAGREYLVLAGTRPADGFTPPPGGTHIVRTCEVQSGQGKQPLALGDSFVIKGDPRHQRTGLDICRHYNELTESTKSPGGLVIATHIPSGDGVPLPAGSKIVPKGLVFDDGGTETQVPDDVVLIIQGKVGGTNLHRGHNFKVDDDGSVSATAENADKVNNWSTGCQVTPWFADYNLFILLAGLSKRWKCLQGSPPPQCPRIQTGSASSPDPFVWANAETKASLHSKDLKAQMKDDTEGLQKQRAEAQADVMSKVEAWFKAQQKKRPKKDADAEAQVVAWYDDQSSALAAKVAADQTALAAAGPPSSDAAKAAKTTLDQDTDKQKALTGEQQDLSTAIAARKDLDRRLSDLDAVLSGLDTKSDTFQAKQEVLEGQAEAMGERAAKLAASPEAQKAALAVKSAAGDVIDDMHDEAFKRAVRMHHDWMRTCDLLAESKQGYCPQRFSYTLIELSPGDPSSKMPSVEALDAEFSKKAGGADAYPKWNGFDVK